ncbi:unnamed protein product [Rotaria magnacalcarata]|uniref:J domain-containing protein n=1 Tax=Rotaria magnacalcarata TaxID=392030 RepID=A0A815SJ01_9BILA|nr:unnamed protein product [Rotaria magnacalcarata]CAF1648515.1 unnamed protein product [Rotaria magnacalcarata]
MFLFRYLVLLLIPIYTSTNHCNQNEIFVDKKLHQRIKRLFNRRSSKFRVDSDTISKSNQRYDNLFLPSNDGEKSKLETKIKYIQQDLAEIKRILSKKEHDYYGILNIDKDATQDKIVTAHRKLTLIVHPDKINVSGATEATQRLNKARIVLLKTIEIQNQGINQLYYSYYGPLEYSTREKQGLNINTQDDKSHYFLFAFMLLIIGIIICIIYWKKRQRRIQSFSFDSDSKQSKIPPTYDSPGLDVGDTINIHDTTEVSIIKNDAATNLVTKT